MFNKEQLINECTNMLRVITSKHFGINKVYSKYMKDFENTVFYNATVAFNDDGEAIWRSYDEANTCVQFHQEVRTETVDVAFAPGVYFGNLDTDLELWGEPCFFGEEGPYAEIFIKFEEPKENVSGFCEDVDKKGVYVIHDSLELAHFMCSVVKEEWDWWATYDAKYGHLLGLLNDYVGLFVSLELRRWNKIFGNIQNDIPILFHRGWANEGHHLKGDLDPTHANLVVNIYKCNLEDEKELKSTLRHELIHYALFNAGLPYWDDSAIFWYFALKLDAKPYKALDSIEQEMLSALNSMDDNEAENFILRLKTMI